MYRGNDMPDRPRDSQTEWWATKLEDIDGEIARLATVCKVRILDTGVVERVLRNDASVCGTVNQVAFDKLRGLLMMHYSVRDHALDILGAEKSHLLVKNIITSLRERFGEQLGGPIQG
jgi:hypothetical protein